jgi:hypothetical protein
LAIQRDEELETTYFWCVEHHWRESRRHLTVESNLDPSLDLVFGLDKRVEEFVGVDDRLAVISHQTNKCSVPLVDDLGESR